MTRYRISVFLLTVFLGSLAIAEESSVPQGFNFKPEEVVSHICRSRLAEVHSLQPLKDDAQVIQKYGTQIREMVVSAKISDRDLHLAQFKTNYVLPDNFPILILQFGSAPSYKYFYIIPAKKDQKSRWGRLGSPEGLKDLGPVLELATGFRIVQSESNFKMIYNGGKVQQYWRFYGTKGNQSIFDGKIIIKSPYSDKHGSFEDGGHVDLVKGGWTLRPVADMPDEVRKKMDGRNIQYLLDLGLIDNERLKKARYYTAQSITKKVKIDILEFEEYGQNKKTKVFEPIKIRIYFAPVLARFTGRVKYTEFGLLNTGESVAKFGDRFILEGGAILSNEAYPDESTPSGTALLDKISSGSGGGAPINGIFETSNSAPPQGPLIGGPADLEAYKTERELLQQLTPEINGELLSSIHSYSMPLESALSALKHKKQALQNLVFNEFYWGADSAKIDQVIKHVENKNPSAQQEVDEVVGEILGVRQKDLSRYLEFLSQIEESGQLLRQKMEEFSRNLDGKTSQRYSVELAESQALLTQYYLALKGRLGAIDAELRGVGQTISYFKQVNLILTLGQSQSDVDPKMLNDLKVLREILSSISGKNTKGLFLTPTNGVSP